MATPVVCGGTPTEMVISTDKIKMATSLMMMGEPTPPNCLRDPGLKPWPVSMGQHCVYRSTLCIYRLALCVYRSTKHYVYLGQHCVCV